MGLREEEKGHAPREMRARVLPCNGTISSKKGTPFRKSFKSGGNILITINVRLVMLLPSLSRRQISRQTVMWGASCRALINNGALLRPCLQLPRPKGATQERALLMYALVCLASLAGICKCVLMHRATITLNARLRQGQTGFTKCTTWQKEIKRLNRDTVIRLASLAPSLGRQSTAKNLNQSGCSWRQDDSVVNCWVCQLDATTVTVGLAPFALFTWLSQNKLAGSTRALCNPRHPLADNVLDSLSYLLCRYLWKTSLS